MNERSMNRFFLAQGVRGAEEYNRQIELEIKSLQLLLSHST